MCIGVLTDFLRLYKIMTSTTEIINKIIFCYNVCDQKITASNPQLGGSNWDRTLKATLPFSSWLMSNDIDIPYFTPMPWHQQRTMIAWAWGGWGNIHPTLWWYFKISVWFLIHWACCVHCSTLLEVLFEMLHLQLSTAPVLIMLYNSDVLIVDFVHEFALHRQIGWRIR